jgi:hypothetical protein
MCSLRNFQVTCSFCLSCIIRWGSTLVPYFGMPASTCRPVYRPSLNFHPVLAFYLCYNHPAHLLFLLTCAGPPHVPSLFSVHAHMSRVAMGMSSISLGEDAQQRCLFSIALASPWHLIHFLWQKNPKTSDPI